jgi:AcrR family transcriptional regulator
MSEKPTAVRYSLSEIRSRGREASDLRGRWRRITDHRRSSRPQRVEIGGDPLIEGARGTAKDLVDRGLDDHRPGPDLGEILRHGLGLLWGNAGGELASDQPPSFYAAFGSKERLFFDAVELNSRMFGIRPIQALEAASTAREGVRAMLRGSAEIFTGSETPPGCLVFLGAVNCAPASKSVQDRMVACRTQAPAVIRNRLTRGVAEGDVPSGVDLEPAVSLYATLLNGLPLRARDGATRAELLAAVEAAVTAWDQLTKPPISPPSRSKREPTHKIMMTEGEP